MIGSFGDVAFECANGLVRTFRDFQRSGSAMWAQHSRIAGKPVCQFIAPELETLNFSMDFSAELGVNPRKEIDKLRLLKDDGVANMLILDGHPIGTYVITQLSENWQRIDNHGGLIAAQVSVSMLEYIEVVTA